VRDLGDNNAMILRHHGLLTTRRTVGDAFYEMYYLEQACRLQVAATQGGQKVVVPPDSVAEHAAQQFESFLSKGQRPWAVLTRRLDRECSVTRLDVVTGRPQRLAERQAAWGLVAEDWSARPVTVPVLQSLNLSLTERQERMSPRSSSRRQPDTSHRRCHHERMKTFGLNRPVLRCWPICRMGFPR
jgi:hypothetical protein